MTTNFMKMLLGVGLAACLAGCPADDEDLGGGQRDAADLEPRPDAGGAGRDASPADAAPPDAPARGPVTVKVVDRLGLPVAGLDVVFHGPDGKAIDSTVTGSDGQATELMDSGGGVTVIEVTSQLQRKLTSALGVPAGATLLVHSVRQTPFQEFRPSPRLPRLPDLPPVPQFQITVTMPCPEYPVGGTATSAGPIQLWGTRDCIAADGTYSVEAVLGTQDGPAFYTRRDGIPATDLTPELPAWRSDLGLFRRRIAHAGLWSPTFSLSVPSGIAELQGSAIGDERYVQTLGPAYGQLIVDGTLGTAAGAVLRVRLHQNPPFAATATLDLEPDRPRAPRQVRLSSDVRPLELAWEETSDGVAPRFVIAETSWLISRTEPTPELASVGEWKVIMPSGSRHLVFPELPVELRRHLPPQNLKGTTFTTSVNLLDDTAVAGYDALLGEDPLSWLGRTPPRREREHLVRLATAGTFSFSAPKASGVTIAAQPAATGRWVRLSAGATLRLTSHVEGSSDQGVTWSAYPPPASFEVAGAGATLRADVPGQTIVVSVRSEAEPTAADDLYVEVVPPACLSPWPLLHPTRPRAKIEKSLHIPVAVRRDGTPVVALATVEGSYFTGLRVNAVAFDGATWSDLAPPIPVTGWQYLQATDSPLAMVLDGQERPILALFDEAGIAVYRLEDGAWKELTARIPAMISGDLLLALDPAGDPVVVTTLPSGYRDSAVKVWRWKDGKWTARTAHQASSEYAYLRVRSLVMDGDVPIVAFEGDGGPGVVRLDDVAIDLGPIDSDATAYATPIPLLALPAPGQPLVAWLDPVSGGPDADLVVRAAQRGPGGWEPRGGALAVPRPSTPPHALLWDPAARRAVVASAAGADGTAQVRALDGDAPLCAPLTDPAAVPYGIVEAIGMALAPGGGYVVATGLTRDDLDSHLTVQRIRP